MSEELKKCPFCGCARAVTPMNNGGVSKAGLSGLEVYEQAARRGGNEWVVGCGNCCAYLMPFNTKEDALDAWNRRADGWRDIAELDMNDEEGDFLVRRPPNDVAKNGVFMHVQPFEGRLYPAHMDGIIDWDDAVTDATEFLKIAPPAKEEG